MGAMGPKPEICGELLQPLRVLMGLKQVATHWSSRHGIEPVPQAATGLLAELVYCGESRASELAHHRIVDASVVSRQLAQLEHAGLITRRPDPADKRVSRLQATSEGEHALAELERLKSEWLSNALRDWKDDDVRQLAELLRTAVTDIRRAAYDLTDLATKEGTR
jgi:DNA-binding MarR family transcriptional regulator